MALQVWLPLNGNLNNQGLSNITITNNGAVADDNGKIGKCYYFGGSPKRIQMTLPSSFTTIKNKTIAMWVKSTGSVIACGGISQNSNYTIASFTLYTSGWQFCNGSNYNYLSSGLAANEGVWHHVACTIDDDTITTYKDGVKVTSGSLSSLGYLTNLTSSHFLELGADFPGGDEYFIGYLNDFRVYDHCLSPKEVKELSKGLVLHYKLNQVSGSTTYDCSGYGNNGTIGGTLTTNTDSSRYGASTVFNGSSYINAGRGAMVMDAISVCCWGYMTSWSSYNARLMSCTEGGGWNFEPASGKMNFACGTGASSNVYKSATGVTALSALTSGWHQFVGTYDGFNTKIYIDGVLDGTNAAYTTKTPLFYNSTNAIFVGAEASSSASAPVGQYFNGRLSDVRIYATALSADDIKELYDTSTFIANNGTIGSYEFVEESSSPQIFKSGVFKSTNISEYSNNLKILSDGSVWVRMLYHSTPSSNLFTESNCWNNDASNLYSRLGMLKDTSWKSSSGKYEFLVYEKLESSSSEGVYRWTQTSNPATATTASGYVLVSGSPAHLSPGICSSNGQHGAIDISGSDWWCCLGCYTAYQGGIPGFNGVVKSGYIDFYVRVPDVKMLNEDKAILHSDNIQSKQIIEI